MLGEFDDVTVQMERERNNAGQMASKQRKFDQQLGEERKNYQALQADRDNMEKMARQNETKVLSMQNNLAEMEDRLADVGLYSRYSIGTLVTCNCYFSLYFLRPDSIKWFAYFLHYIP